MPHGQVISGPADRDDVMIASVVMIVIKSGARAPGTVPAETTQTS
jgi:hypothetical protein